MLVLEDRSLLRTDAYIDGVWTKADSGARFPVSNPATGQTIAEVSDLTDAETRRAIDAAQRAFGLWRGKLAKERAGLLRAWFDLVMASREDLARLLTAEQGKPLSEARGEVAYGAAFIEWFAEEARRTYGDVIPPHKAGNQIVVFKEPVGVVGAITPWNFPVAMITRKCAPALAAGCTVVVKPAEDTPLCALALAALAERAGIPRGVFNVVTTSRPASVGGELTGNPLVRKFSFTGSTEIGRQLARQCAATLKNVSLELGGNAPFIVFDDADLDAAADGALAAKYRNMGQTCVCANRVLVQDSVYEAFARKLAERVATLKIGNGADEDVTQGPLINADGVAKVERLLGEATSKGAKIAMGGKRLDGNFFQPTIVTEATAGMAIAHEEIFGPVAALYRFHSEEEAIRMANDTEYGLAAYFYARDIGRVLRVSAALEYGIVGANEGLVSTEVAPFGGMKQSGIGREGSKYGINEFLEIKYVALGVVGKAPLA